MTIFKHSAVYTDLITDTMYVVTGDEVRPFFGGSDRRIGVWRSPKFISRSFTGYAWARVNGRLNAPVTLRVYVNGTLKYTTPPITSRDPVRLPAGRHEMWEIEVECTGGQTSVLLASSLKELQGA